MTITEKLLILQAEIRCPKNQKASFGGGRGYNYRSCEDILKEAKPILEKVKAVLIIKDNLIEISNSVYIESTVTLKDCEGDESLSSTAFAKEGVHPGLSPAQCTGAASSYARKYALNGLFAIDNTEDEDDIASQMLPKGPQNTQTQARPSQASQNQVKPSAVPMTPDQKARVSYGENYTRLVELCKKVAQKDKNGSEKLASMWGKASASEIETEANEWLKE